MSDRMTWEEKFAACQALGDAVLRMRKPGDWYVDQHAEIKDGCILKGEYGNGATPEAAALDHFEKLTALAPGEYVVTRAMGADRRAVRWNGYMWASVQEKEAVSP